MGKTKVQGGLWPVTGVDTAQSPYLPYVLLKVQEFICDTVKLKTRISFNPVLHRLPRVLYVYTYAYILKFIYSAPPFSSP